MRAARGVDVQRASPAHTAVRALGCSAVAGRSIRLTASLQ
jgi:hypothetical protein